MKFSLALLPTPCLTLTLVDAFHHSMNQPAITGLLSFTLHLSGTVQRCSCLISPAAMCPAVWKFHRRPAILAGKPPSEATPAPSTLAPTTAAPTTPAPTTAAPTTPAPTTPAPTFPAGDEIELCRRNALIINRSGRGRDLATHVTLGA